MRIVIALMAIAALLAGCKVDGIQSAPASPALASFEIRDLTTQEEEVDKTEYSPKWNKWRSTGTLAAVGVPTDKALIVILEYKDTSDGANPAPGYTSILVRRGTGKVDLQKSEYGELTARPNYVWSVLGWHELENATVTTVN